MTGAFIDILSTKDLSKVYATSKNKTIDKADYDTKYAGKGFFAFCSRFIFWICSGQLYKESKDWISKNSAELDQLYKSAEKIDNLVKTGILDQFIVGTTKVSKGQLETIRGNLTYIESTLSQGEKESFSTISDLIVRINTAFLKFEQDKNSFESVTKKISEGDFDHELMTNKLKLPNEFQSSPFIKALIKTRIDEIGKLKEEISTSKNWKDLLHIYNDSKSYFMEIVKDTLINVIKNVGISTKDHLDLYKELDQFVNVGNDENFKNLTGVIKLAKDKLKALKEKVAKPVCLEDLPEMAMILNRKQYPEYICKTAEENIISFFERNGYSIEDLTQIVQKNNGRFNEDLTDLIQKLIDHKIDKVMESAMNNLISIENGMQVIEEETICERLIETDPKIDEDAAIIGKLFATIDIKFEEVDSEVIKDEIPKRTKARMLLEIEEKIEEIKDNSSSSFPKEVLTFIDDPN